MMPNTRRKPEWLKIKLPSGDNFQKLNRIVGDNNLHTICSSGKCPNMGECWGAGTATFMILGNVCTRCCKFCNVQSGVAESLDSHEPVKIAESVKLLKLKHCVITSVTRDDLQDGGAEHWAETIRQIKKYNPNTTIEGLIPDFDANRRLIEIVANTKPEIVSHNLETVRSLTPSIRSRAKYEISLNTIKIISESGVIAKSGIMLGLGETEQEILKTMDDLLYVGCKVMTIGQYLQPTKLNIPVLRYVTPEEFKKYEVIGKEKGFEHVESGPLVRSSYHAEKHVRGNECI